MADRAAVPNASSPCPRCGAHVPVDPAWPAWCECGWNLAPPPAAAPAGVVARWYAALGARQGRATFERVRARGAGRPGFDLATVLLGLLTLLTLAAMVAWPAAAVALLAYAGPSPWTLAAAAALLFVAWGLRPRGNLLPRDALTSPATHPALHRLVADVAREVGVRAPRRIALEPTPTACVTHTGRLARPTLVLGLPLLWILEAQQWVALLAHELAHLRNGDLLRRAPVAAALQTLVHWVEVTAPCERGGARRAPFAALALLWVIGLAPRAALWAMVHLAWRRSQVAEYYADRLAASVSGTGAAISLAESLLDEHTFARAAHAIVVARSGRTYREEILHQAARRPPRELERLRRVAALTEARLDAGHPPLGWRIRMLRDRPVPTARHVLSEARHAAILRELAPAEARVHAHVVTAARRALES